MRKCDPGADNRLPIDRASQCWNDDHGFGCPGQSAGQCAPGRPPIDQYDRHYSPPPAGGAVWERGNHKQVTTTTHVESLTVRGPAPHQKISRSSSTVQADPGSVDIEQANHPFGLVCTSGHSASFLNLFVPFLSRSLSIQTSLACENRSQGSHPGTRLAVISTSLQRAQRTHSWIRVSHEKRNADECPPTGGKSDCHR